MLRLFVLICVLTLAMPALARDGKAPSGLVTRKAAIGHRDFNHAKQVLTTVYSGSLQKEFYCGCRYEGKKVDLNSCGFVPRKSAFRAQRIEWEHIVTAWDLGHQRQCWQTGGRKYCSAHDPVFQMAEGDLNNLVPAVGEVNGDRSNFPYGVWDNKPQPMYGKCQTIVDFKGKRAQPRREVRGHIARVYFHMHERYRMRVSKQDHQLMCAWAKAYPIQGWERASDHRIAALQGEGNRYIQNAGAIAAQCGKH